MSIAILLQQVAVIFMEIAVGFLGGKMNIITDRDSKFLSNLVMTITLPCALIASANVDGGGNMVRLMLIGFLCLEVFYLATAGICLLIAKYRKMTKGQVAVFIGTAVMPNSAFIGIPLATAILGTSLGNVYSASGILAYNIFFFTYVVQLFQPGKKFEIRSLITPTNITTVIMTVMLLFGIRLPAPIQSFFSAVGGCTTPLALMIVGVMLSGSKMKEMITKPFLYLITALRCVIFPLLFILILRLLPLDRTMCMGVSILAACPSGSLAAVLAKQYNMESELAGQAVTHSTIFILVTIPLLLTLAGQIYGIS